MVDIEKLSKRRKEWIGCWGNIWQSRKVEPGTCTACVFGEGTHSETCTAGRYNLVDLPRATADGQYHTTVWVPSDERASQK